LQTAERALRVAADEAARHAAKAGPRPGQDLPERSSERSSELGDTRLDALARQPCSLLLQTASAAEQAA
jgi:hypothetical protein